ncbi:hypothetical protein ACVW1A_004257 [Bradyrhizobium sp. LB1.3]
MVSLAVSLARSRPPIHKPQLPDGVRIYAISDIHGCSHLLQPMLGVIDADVTRSRPAHAIEVFMGDYIDRGPNTRSTLDILVERSRRGNAVFLKGNHEAFLVKVFEDPSLFEDWIRLGGSQTLMSYGLAPDLTRDDPASILRDLIRAMPLASISNSWTICGLAIPVGTSSLSTPAFARVYLWPSNENTICSGFAKNFFGAKSSSASILSMVTRRFVPPKSWRIASISIPVPTRRAI